MPMMSVTCRRCGSRLEVDAAFLGETLYCSSCNSAVRIEADAPPAPPEPSAPAPAAGPADAAAPAAPPAPPSPASPPAAAPRLRMEPSKLRLAGDRIASGEGRACPKCSFIMGEEDVVCANCGHNTKTGVSMAEVARRREALGQFVKLATSILVIVALGWVAWKAGWLSFDVRDLIAEDSPPAASRAGPETATNAAGPELPPPPPEIVDSVTKQVTDFFDRTYPVVSDGMGVAFERTDGRVLRGVFRAGKDQGTFGLETVDGGLSTHEFNRLKPGSRLRCDPDYRAAEIRREVGNRLGT